MNPLYSTKKQTTLVLLVALGVACFGLSPSMQAVIPAADGGYPGGNTAEGQSALLSLTTGGFNTAVGWFSLKSLTTGSFNTGVGAGTLVLNSGDENTATGVGALLSNTTGGVNTADGVFALLNNTTGSSNTATGVEALFSNTTGFDNTATGNSALLSNTTGGDNTATGTSALVSNTTGDSNTANGAFALFSNTTGLATAVGKGALFSNTTGTHNTANGLNALFSNTTGNFNTANGDGALYGNTTGSQNTANGYLALVSNTTGNFNVAFGAGAGASATTGSNNVYIGTGMSGVAGESNACYIASVFGQTSATGIPVLVGSDNKLGTTTSSQRFKEDIKPMDKASEALLALRPVTFRYKKDIDPAGTSQFGLVAEEVEKVNPYLVVRDKEGKPYSVRYDQVNAMLLNEFLKEHRKVQEQEATITQLKKDFRATIAQLTARLDEQAAQIQKVTAQLEASKLAPQVVNNP